MITKILIVEDEIDIREGISEYLSEVGYDVMVAEDGQEGIDLFKSNEFDLVLLDIMLPKINGFGVLSQIREISDVPVMMLTAMTDDYSQIMSFNEKADDYITKPFEIREVLARIQVQLRHIEAETKSEAEAEIESETEVKTKAGIQEGQGSGRLEFRDMVLIRSTFEVSIGGRVLPKITKQEFAILELLLKNPKQVFSKEDIFEYAWDEPYMGETKTLDVHISNIRKKIKTITPDEYIETIWGIGYRLHE